MTAHFPIDSQEPLHTDDRLRGRLTQYAGERLATLKRRAVIYFFGCIFMMWATTPLVGLGLTLVILSGELVDCLCLLKLRRRLEQGASYKALHRLATVGGLTQCLAITAAVTIYVFSWGQDGTILGVAAVLGMGAINATLILPTNPKIAITKLTVFGITPILLFLVQIFVFRAPNAAAHLDAHSMMALMCMAYMCYSFSRASYDNAEKTEHLSKRERDLFTANAKLRAHQDELLKLSMVARRTNDTVVLMSSDRTVEWVNEAFTKLNGIPAEEAIGRNIYDLIRIAGGKPDDFLDIAKATQGGDPLRTEIHNTLPDGSPLWVDFQLLPVKNDEGKIDFLVTIARDITAVKEHSESMRIAREAAEDAAKAKSRFLANMSHEIRTPLTGIIGMADLLADTEQTEDQEVFTQTILSSSRSLLTIINDILDLSKLEAGKLSLSETKFELRHCFEEVTRLLTPAAQEKDIALSLNIESAVPAQVISDDVRIRQIATNIIGNATKFTEQGQVDVKVWTEWSEGASDPQKAMLHFVVKDTGIGIPEKKLQSIFEEFSQAESSTTRRFGGTGLGLAICRRLTTEMGGEIAVQSTLGAGTTVHVTLPVTIPAQDNDTSPAPVAPLKYDAIDLAGLKILVAEDNKTNRLLIRKYLEPLPITLHFAENGYAAVEATLQHAPDLIFMDMSMPVMSGIEATEAIRGADVKQPSIVALTANVFDSEKEACLAAGMNDFLTKPIRRNELVDCIQRHVGHRNVPGSAVRSALDA
ncbi:response regulator [Shimia sp. R9_1]|uniref:ATP-binding protein n=1 Tax=Shimia sp. R9_1 TaxID=2821111 RepID=UPI001ADC6889|nr:ATP-binding protein [Shimia sp. R9_1]MBO9407112.1 response regulator [Shimia sp. R9_1]